MTRDDIMKMAEEAEVLDANWQVDELERFAQLVAAAEREACAKLLEDWDKHNWNVWDCAAAIRARGQQ